MATDGLRENSALFAFSVHDSIQLVYLTHIAFLRFPHSNWELNLSESGPGSYLPADPTLQQTWMDRYMWGRQRRLERYGR